MVSLKGLRFVVHDFLVIMGRSHSSLSFKVMWILFLYLINQYACFGHRCSPATLKFADFLMSLHFPSYSFIIAPVVAADLPLGLFYPQWIYSDSICHTFNYWYRAETLFGLSLAQRKRAWIFTFWNTQWRLVWLCSNAANQIIPGHECSTSALFLC